MKTASSLLAGGSWVGEREAMRWTELSLGRVVEEQSLLL